MITNTKTIESTITVNNKKSILEEHGGTTKTNDLFAMIGTLFLWMYWPSFNGVLAPIEMSSQHRVIINTTLSLVGSAFATFIIS